MGGPSHFHRAAANGAINRTEARWPQERATMRKRMDRLFRLLLGLFLYALGIVLTMKANLGFAPWEVFHTGLGKVMGITIGNISIITGLVIVLAAFAMGEKLGLGTLLNMVLIGVFMDMLLRLGWLVPMTHW